MNKIYINKENKDKGYAKVYTLEDIKTGLRDIEINLYRKENFLPNKIERGDFEINWSGCGSQSVKNSKEFSRVLNKAIELAEELNK